MVIDTSKATPGPWRAIPWSGVGGEQTIEGHGSLLLANILGQGPEANRANARLIAAAPKLLAALEALVTEAGEHAIDSGHTFRTLDQARKAIEAAR